MTCPHAHSRVFLLVSLVALSTYAVFCPDEAWIAGTLSAIVVGRYFTFDLIDRYLARHPRSTSNDQPRAQGV